jgi:fatty-acyl-CoA synthase
VLTAGAIAAQLSMLAQALRIDPERDVSVDWVPLSHDMGLFGCLLMTAYWTGTRLVLGTPQRFLTSPQSWFGDLADFQGTISAGPNFALELAARVATLTRPGPIPLTRLVLGGERVDAGTIERACDALGPARLPRDAVAPAYGMAEAVLAVSATEPGAGPTVLSLDREALAGGQLIATQPGTPNQPATAVVSAGIPLEGISVDIADGRPVGELRVRTPSQADGYLDLPAVSAERFTDDGFLTGDIGFVRDGHVYVTGRADDLLSVAGRNVYACDIESAITTATAARAGCCAVVDIDGVSEPRLVAVLEPAKGHPSFEVMAGAMVEAARAAVGVRLSECVFLPHGQFPKTPTGKVQRFRCRELASDRSFTHAKRVTL